MKLNPDLNFETLIPTSGNRAALNAAREFATSRKSSLDFLLLHGPPAVGKTHLLHAIHSAASMLQPKSHVLHITCEKWNEELLAAIRSERTEEFRNKYRQIDILLMDDIQILSGKPITQQFLADYVQTLVHAGCGVALTYSGRLSAIPFATGVSAARPKRLIVEIGAPTSEEMHQVLLSKFGILYRTIPLNCVKAACLSAHGDIRRAEGRLNSILLYRKIESSFVGTSAPKSAIW